MHTCYIRCALKLILTTNLSDRKPANSSLSKWHKWYWTQNRTETPLKSCFSLIMHTIFHLFCKFSCKCNTQCQTSHSNRKVTTAIKARNFSHPPLCLSQDSSSLTSDGRRPTYRPRCRQWVWVHLCALHEVSGGIFTSPVERECVRCCPELTSLAASLQSSHCSALLQACTQVNAGVALHWWKLSLSSH